MEPRRPRIAEAILKKKNKAGGITTPCPPARLQTILQSYSNQNSLGTSLVVQWLRLHTPTVGGTGSTLVRELRSCMPCGAATEKKTTTTTVILAQKQTYGSVEQKREPRNKPTHLWTINLRERRQEYTMEKTVSSASGIGKVGQPHVN